MTRPLRLALVGHSNTGKTTLFNTLTGYQQKVANYPGVTVEGKFGHFKTHSGRLFHIVDLPGTYSLNPISPDEEITCQFCDPHHPQGASIDMLLCVVDATQLEWHLKLALQAKSKGKPMLIALNRMQEAKQQGIDINIARLQQGLGIPVIPIHAKHKCGIESLLEWLDKAEPKHYSPTPVINVHQLKALITQTVTLQSPNTYTCDDYIDRWALHPVWGPMILGAILFLMFQAIFTCAEPIKHFIEATILKGGHWITSGLSPDGLLYGLVNEGILAGVATVFTFCPQILLLFCFLLILEESGYLPRAAFLLDPLFAKVGLTGRSLIPLLSSFGCAIPSIMATRSIQHPRDRLVTILITPLITCSARLPIYTLLISAFIPSIRIGGLLNLQGIILFILYIIGIASALCVAWIMKRYNLQSDEEAVLLMELPSYQFPSRYNIVLTLRHQLKLFLKRIGTIILALTILLWGLCRFPGPPLQATQPAIYYSFAGHIGRILAFFLNSIGFNWQICIALVPGLAAREVAISALGTVYAMSGSSERVAAQLSDFIAHQWTLPTALSLLMWYVFAPQCLSTLITIRRETHSRRIMFIAAAYLFGLAYCASFVTYHLTRLWLLNLS
jgi:ferrous iron transport protein B